MDGGLVLVDVERRAGDQALLERPGQRRFIDDRTARGVDRDTPSASCARAPSVDEVPGLGVSGTCSETTSDVLSRRSSDIRSAPASPLSLRDGVGDAHAEHRRPRGDRARDAAEADEPSCLPLSSVPSMKSNAQPFHSPRRIRRSPSASRRVTARISAHVKSATDSVSTSGVLVTMMPRDRACGDVDVVVADGHVRHDLQVAAGVDQRRVDLLGQHATTSACFSATRCAQLVRAGSRRRRRTTST